jgi:endonuclease/exonuclease/phosphatase family metal-dependent hydrolase
MSDHQATPSTWQDSAMRSPSYANNLLQNNTKKRNRPTELQTSFNTSFDKPKPNKKLNDTIAAQIITKNPTTYTHKRSFIQTRIDRDTTTLTSNYASWGDKLEKCKQNFETLRIAFRNVQFLPAELPNSRHDELIQDIQTNDIDIIGLAETNLCWPNLTQQNKPKQRFSKEFETVHCSYSFNSNNIKNFNKQQYGGTMILCINKICHHVLSSGYDSKNLGRWSWTKIRGINNQIIRILCLYRPVISSCVNGVYRQQQTYLLEQNNDNCPRKQLLDDLEIEITNWQAENEHIIIMGDFNENIASNSLATFFNKFQMREVIQGKHGKHSINTHANGTLTIDGIFMSNTLFIKNGGYSPVYWGMSTDHRLLWVDLDTTNLLIKNNIELWKPKGRRLKLENLQSVNKYLNLRIKHSIDNNLEENLRTLLNTLSATTPIDLQSAQTQFDTLDKIRTEGILVADKKCRKLPMGNLAWTPLLTEIIRKIQYYRGCVKQYTKVGNVRNKTLYKQQKRSKIDVAPKDIEESTKLLHESYILFNNYKKNPKSQRANYLEKLASSYSIHNNIEYASAIKNIIKREYMKDTFKKISNTLKPSRVGVSKIEIPAPNSNQWQLVTTKDEIELGCIQENVRRFTQANHSPAMQPSAVELIGIIGNNKLAQNIKDNIITPDYLKIHEDLRQLLPYYSKPTQLLENINTSITMQEMRHFWRNSNEKTSTGISGIHYGHFKASNLSDKLTFIDKTFLEISMKFGLNLSRWNQCIDVMIPKKSDTIKVNKLRTIMLFECDWNQMNKIIGNRVMANAEKYKTIAPEQYGSRRGKSSIQHAINKVLLFDLLRQKRTDAALIILDALSCYDRIILLMAALGLMRQGILQSKQ